MQAGLYHHEGAESLLLACAVVVIQVVEAQLPCKHEVKKQF